MNLLNKINSPKDIKSLSYNELITLCDEIRQEIIETVSQNGGHLASNLGVVELTVALHKTFDSPIDSIIFDVSHQCYTHKILTGRFSKFKTLRTPEGISGFTNPDESEHDLFKIGHSSTSISHALGIASAKKLNNDDSYTVAVIGDGSLSSGLAYEGLNNAGHSNTRLIIVINDNKMSISKNVGGIAKHLTSLRSSKSYHLFKGRLEKILLSIPFVGKYLRNSVYRFKKRFKNFFYNSNIFEDMGFNYLGPIDGHDIKKLTQILESSKVSNRPAVVHVMTKKGFGYSPAQIDPTSYHSTGCFHISSGLNASKSGSFSDKFGDILVELADKDDRICSVTAAMCDGTGLTKFKEKFPERYFDVGIAEEHAVTFSSGLSKRGKIPVFAVYSSFLQRTYDQLIHDCSLQKSHLILAVDRAGIVGLDGETHQGIFDISFLRSIPDIQIFSPTNYFDLRTAIIKAVNSPNRITAVRFPRGKESELPCDIISTDNDLDIFGSDNAKIAVISYGRIFANVADAVKSNKLNNIKLIKLNKIYPIDFSKLDMNIKNCEKVYIFEETVFSGSVSEYVSINSSVKIKSYTLPNEFIRHGDTETILDSFGLSKEKIADKLTKETQIG